jgi:pantetheine-phosphate adenylyltransferase
MRMNLKKNKECAIMGNMLRKSVYTGTFDPFTNGHNDIVQRALCAFDEVYILVGVHPSKKVFFSAQERVEMIKELYHLDSRITVESWDGLVIDYAKDKGINIIVRGLRPTGDFESEYQMASMNWKLYKKIETIFFMTSGDYNFISSSLVKEINIYKGDISPFVPELILQKIQEKNKEYL